MNLRMASIGLRPKFDLSILAPASGLTKAAALKGTREVWADGRWHEAAVYDRLALPVGAEVDGPAILEQADTTIFVEPDLKGRVDEFGNLIIERKEATT